MLNLREFMTISAIADTPTVALERFSVICNNLNIDRNLKFVDGYKLVEQTPGTWTCCALVEVDSGYNKKDDLASAFR